MNRPLRVLFVEDSADDAELACHELIVGGFDFTYERVETPEEMSEQLNHPPWDLIIADYVLPRFSGLEALRMLQERGIDIPFIIVSGKIGEETAVEAMKAGAHDYFIKGKLTRLAPAVDRELREAEIRRERERSGERLRQNAFELNAIFQALPDLYFRLSSEGIILDCKAGYLGGTLAPPDRFIGKTLETIFPAPIAVEYRSAIKRIRNGEPLVLIEYSDTMSDGEHFFESRHVPLLQDQIMAIIRDITVRRRAEIDLENSEKRFRSVVETASDAIVTMDAEGKILFWNPSAEAIFGHSSEGVLGKHLASMIANSAQGSLEDWMTVLRGKERRMPFPRAVEIVGRRFDGMEFPIELSLSSWKSGSACFFTAILRDISFRKNLERDLLRAGKLESLGVLAGGIAHDFNNLLTVVFGSLGLAKRNINNPSQLSGFLDSAERSCKRASSLTQQLLSFSKGGIPIKTPSSISETIREAGSAVLGGSQVQIEFNLPADLWAVDIDTGQISQVVQNLVLNASQSMPKGGKIFIRAENITLGKDCSLPISAGRYIKISVADQGIGISPEHQIRIFDPYFTTKVKGTGLGLAIAYSILKKHDGFITLSSRLGEGTTFFFYLPASQMARAEKTPDSGPFHADVPRILVMDDEVVIRELLGMALRDAGFFVSLAKDGGEALQIFLAAIEEKKPFSLALLDLNIPGGMGGKETLKKLHEITPDLKAIVSSGYSDDRAESDFRASGFDAVLAKPYDLDQMIFLLRKVLSQTKTSQQENEQNGGINRT
ncbi:MAG: response regulator [Candidatus Ozemobacteraceae bacterium]